MLVKLQCCTFYLAVLAGMSLAQPCSSASNSALQDWLSEAELGQTLESYDADGSGDINFDEFVHMVRPAVCALQRLDSLLSESQWAGGLSWLRHLQQRQH